MNNRLYNCKNYYQGKTKKVLCVCSAGLLRSPTAAVVLNREFGYNTRACGMDTSFALIPFDEVLAYWADEIVVMEASQVRQVPEQYRDKVFCLNIEDSYGYMDKDLQLLIKDAYVRVQGTIKNE